MADILNPDSWRPIPDDPEIVDHVTECATERRKRLNLYDTDDGWFVEVTIPTAGAVTSVSQIFKVAEWDDPALGETFDRLEEIMIWDAGIGMSAELDLPDDATAEQIFEAMNEAMEDLG